MMRRNKKALLYTLIVGVFGLLILMLRLYYTSEAIIEKESLVTGKSALEALQGLHDREVMLQYFDIGSLHASYDAVRDLTMNGGWYGAPCGQYGAVKLWYDRSVACMPADANLSEQLSLFMERDHFATQLATNPFVQGRKDPRDYVYFSEVVEGRTAIEGYSTAPIMLTIMCSTTRKEDALDKTQRIAAAAVGGPIGLRVWDWAVARPATTFACGQIAVRPDFRHELNVSVNTMLSLRAVVEDMVARCEKDPVQSVAPEGCLRAFNGKDGIAVDVQETDALRQEGAVVAILAKKIGDHLPGIEQDVVARIGIKLRKGAVQP
ncbi:MAG: hypothetical protein AABY13_01460 [Nanoarchaeota archaeon]